MTVQMSPRRPPSNRKPPKVSMYAFTTHTSDVSVNAQIRADRRQRHVHDRRVEHDHEYAQTQDDECPPALSDLRASSTFL